MKLKRNILYLFLWQGSLFVIPLVLTPYLSRTLGVHAFGIYGLSVAFSAYGILLADWGFSLSATQKVARAADDPEELASLFWSTMFAKLMLMAGALLATAIAVAAIGRFRAVWPAMAAGSVSVVATALTANFFLQGLQRMAVFGITSVIGRVIAIPLTLLLVHGPGDVTLAVLVYSLSQLFAAVISLVVSTRIVDLGPYRADRALAFRQIADGWHQFVANLAVRLYVESNTVFVGLLSGPLQTGYLTGSQRLQTAFGAMIQPVNLAVYPRINYLTEKDPAAAVPFMFRLLWLQGLYALGLGGVMFAIAPYVVPLFLGEAYRPAIPVAQTLAFVLPFVGVNNVLGTNMMLPLGLKSGYTSSLVVAGVLNVALIVMIAPRYGALAGAFCAVFAELVILVMMGSALWRNRRRFAEMRAAVPATALT